MSHLTDLLVHNMRIEEHVIAIVPHLLVAYFRPLSRSLHVHPLHMFKMIWLSLDIQSFPNEIYEQIIGSQRNQEVFDIQFGSRSLHILGIWHIDVVDLGHAHGIVVRMVLYWHGRNQDVVRWVSSVSLIRLSHRVVLRLLFLFPMYHSCV